jgi:hypothetical protein
MRITVRLRFLYLGAVAKRSGWGYNEPASPR